MARDRPAFRGGAGRHARRQPLHHPYGRGRGLRPLRAGADRAVSRPLRRAASWASRSHDLLALGRPNPDDRSEPFNMAYLAMRGSGAVNGVSRLHGEVSRRIFAAAVPALAGGRSAGRPRHQRRPHAHLGFRRGRRALDRGLRQGALAGRPRSRLEQGIRQVSDDATCGACATAARRRWSTYARAAPGPAAGGLRAPAGGRRPRPGSLFDPDALTLGFARRFATYKRPNLLLHDPERLLRLLTNPERPVQLILAGKAHPADQAGQAMIRQWMQFIRRPEVRAARGLPRRLRHAADRAAGAGRGRLDQHARGVPGRPAAPAA